MLLNPRLSRDETENYDSCFRRSMLLGHLWIASSGSQSRKLIGLSKKTFLISAEAVNRHLRSTSSDRWGACLPTYHVGGLGIYARAYLSGARVSNFEHKWSASDFLRWIVKERVTLVSLIPTQLHDLVSVGAQSPVGVRAVIIGGSELDEELYLRARKLGWPVLPSYGMTEVGSQIATAPLSSLKGSVYPMLKILDHVKTRQNAEGLLEVRSPSLMSGYWNIETQEFHLVEKDSWYLTEDAVKIEDQNLLPLGRSSDFVKIKGEGFYLSQIENRIRTVAHVEGSLVAIKDPRDGVRLVWVVEQHLEKTKASIAKWNLSAFPLERISEVRSIEKIPVGTLGKQQRQKLTDLVSRN